MLSKSEEVFRGCTVYEPPEPSEVRNTMHQCLGKTRDVTTVTIPCSQDAHFCQKLRQYARRLHQQVGQLDQLSCYILLP